MSSRADGRPEAYDVEDLSADHDGYRCEECPPGVRYWRKGEVFLIDPASMSDGALHIRCKGHIPRDTVIYNPVTQRCRDLDGNEWDGTVPQ